MTRCVAATLGLLMVVGFPATRRVGSEQLSGRIERDVVYAVVAGEALKLDVYYPDVWSTPAPLAVYIHGGGWTSGDKSSGAGLVDKDELLRRGYVVASINYRLAPEHRWPAQIEDCKAAIRFLRANAARFGVDPARIGVWGSSAGGHLVAMLGAADETAGFDDSGGNLAVSSRVAAVVDMFGPSDLTRAGSGSSAVNALVGPDGDEAALANASPVTYVSTDDPPFLLLHGDKDTTVPLWQSQTLEEHLRAVGVPVTLVVVRNGGHGFTPVGGPISPTRAELTMMLADFMDANVLAAGHRPHRRVRSTF